MKTFQHKLLTASVGICLTLGASQVALAKKNDSVSDNQGNVIHNTFGNCVITKWKDSRKNCEKTARLQNDFFDRKDRTVFFDFGSSRLNANARDILDALAQKVNNADREFDGRIVGFADRIGDSAANQRLSERRARNVAAYLRNRGLNISGVDIRNEGETQIFSSCSSNLGRDELIECLGRDRRVEIELR